MPGRMGSDKVTVQNMKVMRIDPVSNILYIKGSIPGREGNWLRIRDSVRPRHSQANLVPFPTALASPEQKEDVFAHIGKHQKDPFLTSA